MWRRYGEDLYALLVLAVFSFEALALGLLTWSFAVGAARAASAGELTAALVATIAVTAVALVGIGSYILGYHVISTRRERGRRERIEAWTATWVSVLFGQAPPPPSPLPTEAVETLVDLREHLTGEEAERVVRLMRRYRIARRLVERARGVDRTGTGLGRLLSSYRYRRLSGRLEALEALAKARLAQTVDPLLGLLEDRESTIRLAALRGLARSLARMPEGRARDRAARRFAKAVARSSVPPGAVEEALLLLEGTAPTVLRLLVAAAAPAPRKRRAAKDRTVVGGVPEGHRSGLLSRALDAVGRLRLLELADDVAPHITHPDPEVRSAALRALARVGILPAGADEGVLAALEDEVDHVRVHATRTAVLLEPAVALPRLWALLGDPSWWVRRASARSLLKLGDEGPKVLERAAREHGDRYGREMALQVLLDAGRVAPSDATALRGAV
jgi:HEAT repeat protein